MAKTSFTHVHVSGLWDAGATRWFAAMRAAMAKGDVITVTEFTQSPLAPAWFRRQGFGMVHFTGEGRNEGVVLYRLERFELVDRWCIPISTTIFALGKGKIRPRTHLTGAKLRDKVTDKLLAAEVFHAPSAIEKRHGLVRGARRARAALECFANVSRHRRTELKGVATIVSADWNLNHALKWVRALLAARMPGLKSAWRLRLRGRIGTHGKRFIDGPRFTRKLKALAGGSRVGPAVAGFDHRMVITTFDWR